MTTDFQQTLEKYAELAVKVGVNLQPGQRLWIRAIPLDVAPLVRAVVAKAYQHGSRLVTVLWEDEHLDKIRYQYAPRDSFEEFPTWTSDGALLSAERGDACLFILSRDPGLLEGVESDLITTYQRTWSKNFKPFNDLRMKGNVQWSIICPPTPEWAERVFPNETPQDAEAHLWEAVFKTCRLNQPDPLGFWQTQVANLDKRKDYLTSKGYAALHFSGPGTDLEIGLPAGHRWMNANFTTKSGVSSLVNVPSEEVFTLPHKDKVNGKVTATKPLSYAGSLIENFSVTFSEGRVVSISAEKGEEVLQSILEIDDGANFLGEIALVPHKTPISQMDLLFLNTLYDENASNHMALGAGIRGCLEGGTDMTEEEFKRAGGNVSLTHVDFMFGSGAIDVDGITDEGAAEPVVRGGEWAFDV